MYGMINSSLQAMIRETFGEHQWEKVLSASGVAEDSFLSMRDYDDASTFDLVEAASAVLDMSAESCLEMLGKWWILETAAKSYGRLLTATGRDFSQFISNLNLLHDRISSTFVGFAPPEFQVQSPENGRYRIHYVSRRRGLTPFVVGLLKGLAVRFEGEAEFHSQTALPTASGEHTIFEVTVKC